MKALKYIELKLPEDIDNVEMNMMQYRIAESRNAYLKLIKKRAIEYYESCGELDEQLSQYNLTVIDQAIEDNTVYLEKERRDNRPLGYAFNEEVIDIELDMYDTIEEQIEYLKRKIDDFDFATVNVVTNEFDGVRNNLKQQIVNRYNKLKNTNVDWQGFLFNEHWDKIVDSHFDPRIIDNILDKVGMNDEDKFREFMRKKYNRKTREEWIKEYATQSKINYIEGVNKDERLSEEEKHHKTVNVWDNNFLDSVLGRETQNRLKLFEEKFVKDESNISVEEKKANVDKRLEEIIELHNIIEGHKKEIREIDQKLKVLHKEYAKLENQFGNDVTKFPLTLKNDLRNKREQIVNAEKERVKIEYKLWGTLEKEGLIWKHDRLYNEYKKKVIDDDKLFNDLNNKTINSYTEKIQLKIKQILEKQNIEISEEELLDLTLEVLAKRIDNEEEYYEESNFEEEQDIKYDYEIEEVLKEKYKISLINNRTDDTEKSNEYPLFDFDIDKIKEYGKALADEDRYKYFVRVQIEIKRILNAFAVTEFKNFDGNIYFGLKEFNDSVKHILEKERCPELTQVVEQEIINLNSDAGEKEFGITLMVIEMQLMKEENRLKKVMELIGYEIEYLEKIMRGKKDTEREIIKGQIIEKITGKNNNHKETDRRYENMKTSSDLSNELANAHSIMIKQRNKIKALEKGITKTDLIDMIEKNKCRKKNRTINYSALAKLLGCSNHTAKSKCKFYGIS